MRKKWYSLANRSLSALLVLLGFQACDSSTTCEYGTPTVDYHVTGQVQDADGNPIKGIRVTMKGFNDFNYGNKEDITYTDKDGRYKTQSVRSMFIQPEMSVVFEDVDGPENGGEFTTESVKSDDMKQQQVKKGDGHWYQGEYELTANKTLKKN